ncbi:MAG: uncharacterized membrane-anchored protein YjiN (DUF445 family) [Candidatus Azotimanducaceae bacterium]|jgi:uncharacterized membrane-anchored protein YjiN (DUF445 family)
MVYYAGQNLDPFWRDFSLEFNNVGEQQKATELATMKRTATGLLVLMTVIFIGTRIFHGEFVWIGFVEATAEAAMIGALADWFAVTALFRHPLGIKIPHTAIIPNRKDSIAEQFGGFVQENFLSEEVISDKVRSMNLSRRVAAWIIEPDNAGAIATQVTAGLSGVVKVMNDKDIQTLIESKVEAKIRSTSFAPIIGDLLTFISSGRRQQDLFDVFVKIGLNLLEDSDDDIREKVQQETPWWFPGSLDKAVYHKIVRGVSKTLYDMQVDIYHPVRVRMMQMSNEFMEQLRHSDDIKEKEISLKEDILNEPTVRDFTHSLWADIKAALLEQSENPDAELKHAIKDAVIKFGHSILSDAALAKKIDGWADDTARYLIRTYGHEVSGLIADTIEGWDPQATSERIELQIGKDLQFIRINGTIVGGLAGLTIYTLSMLPEWFDFSF